MASRLSRALLLCALAVTATMPVGVTGQDTVLPERFTAFAVNMGNFGPTHSDIVNIAVTRWSTDTERDLLLGALLDKGPDILLDKLRHTRRVGFIRTPNSLAYDLHYAQNIPGEDGGRRIILVTDRPISFWEAAHQPRSIDYPFTLIELRLNSDGEGEGKMSIATKITGDRERGVIELEDYALQPVRLLNVHRTKSQTD